METQKSSVTAFSEHLISNILTLIIVGLLICYLYARWDEISTWITLRPEFILPVVALVYISVLVAGKTNQLLLSHFGLVLPHTQWIPLTFVVTALNSIFPSGSGAAARAVYLKKIYEFSITDSTSGFLFSNLLSIFANAFLGLGLTLVMINQIQNGRNLFIFTFLAIALMAVLIIFLPSLRFFRKILNKSSVSKAEINSQMNTVGFNVSQNDENSLTNKTPGSIKRILKIVSNINEGFISLKSHKGIIVQIGSLTLLNTLLYGTRIYLAFWCINQPVSISYCLIAGVLASLSLVFSITPGGLGVREALLIVAGLAFGIHFEYTLVAVTIERVLTTVSAWAVTPLCLRKLRRVLPG